jgi:cell division protein FtsL
MRVSSILLGVLAVLLLVLAWFLVKRSRKLSRMRQDLEERNSQLASANDSLALLNRELSRADQVKERYIVDFLRRLSNNVSQIQGEENYARNLLKQGRSEQLLKEISLSTRSEKTLKEFCRDFDATFLQAICPDFVARFNALLREEARFHPKPGSLTTELRIFALIRLGVDDSREIANILHYSHSTIYNYKVSVKNAALGDRDSFEEKVKMIGK